VIRPSRSAGDGRSSELRNRNSHGGTGDAAHAWSARPKTGHGPGAATPATDPAARRGTVPTRPGASESGRPGVRARRRVIGCGSTLTGIDPTCLQVHVAVTAVPLPSPEQRVLYRFRLRFRLKLRPWLAGCLHWHRLRSSWVPLFSKVVTTEKPIPDPHGTVAPFSRIHISAGVRLKLSSLSLRLHTQAAQATTAMRVTFAQCVPIVDGGWRCRAFVNRPILGASPRIALAMHPVIRVWARTEQHTIRGLKLKWSHVCNR
jgi:hypothetical protein